ncbi:hypothetical protein WDW37_00170 [Bdellovibrionota bacterium FG-1]
MESSKGFLVTSIVALMAIGPMGSTAQAELEGISPHVCDRGPGDFQKLAFDRSMRMAESNRGGMFQGGVCWWHSRLQRAAIYLTEFRPDLPKPTAQQAARLLKSLSAMKWIVVIPGYFDFQSFTADFYDLVQARLEAWQREDGILKFRWISGLTGHTQVAPSSLQYIMERIHDMVAVQHRIVFEKLQIPGIAAHAWLLIGSEQTPEGYTIQVIDSNDPHSTQEIRYQFGDRSLSLAGSGTPLVPYLMYEGDLVRIFTTLSRQCGR